MFYKVQNTGVPIIVTAFVKNVVMSFYVYYFYLFTHF